MMKIADFKLEHYFSRWEFVAPLMLGSSDAETLSVTELLDNADRECRDWWDQLQLGYTEVAGHPRLRAEIASLYERIEPSQVIVFAGAEEAIFAFMNVVVSPADRVMVVWPGYQSLYELPRSLAANVTLLRLKHEDRWKFPLEQFETLASDGRPHLIAINYPHSPTGAHLDETTYRTILNAAERHGSWLLSDEVYRFAEHDPATRLPAAADLSSRAASVGVMSKAFGLAGLRIGWIASRDETLISRLAAFKHYLTICNSAPAEVLATIALRARTRLLERNRTIALSNLTRLDAFFETVADLFEWVRPQAGTIAFPRLLANMPIDAFAEQLASQMGVVILPGSVFDHPGNHFRIGYGRRNLPEALERLTAFARQVPAITMK